MESKAKFLGHSLHQMLIVFPLGLLITSMIFDVIYLLTGNGAIARTGFHMIAAGIIGGALASLPGWVDWLAIPRGTRAKRVGITHGLANNIMLVMFGISWWLRRDAPQAPGSDAMVFSLLAVLIGGFAAWLGGELVDRLGVGVDPGAHLNAPSSLTHPARELNKDVPPSP